MKRSIFLKGLRAANKNYYSKADNNKLYLSDGTELIFSGPENDGPNDCYTYADLSVLEDTGFFEDTSIAKDTLRIEPCENYGFRINGYFVPCYSVQDGNYSNKLTIMVYDKEYNIINIITCYGEMY